MRLTIGKKIRAGFGTKLEIETNGYFIITIKPTVLLVSKKARIYRVDK